MKVYPLGAAWLVEVGGARLLVDAPDGCASAWRAAGLPADGPDAALLTAPCRVEGLFALLSACPDRCASLPLLHGMDDAVTGALVAAWSQVGARAYAPALTLLAPGAPEDLGFAKVLPLPAGGGLSWLVAAPDVAVVFASGGADPAAIARLGVDRVIWTERV